MDVPREQSQPAPAAPPPPEQHQPAPSPAAYAAPAAPSSLEVGARLARLLLHRSARVLARGWGWARPQLGWIILTTFLLGIISALGLSLALSRLVGATAGEPADARAAMIQPATAVLDFLRGQQTYDADLMWESFSPQLRSALEQQEITREALAEYMESERQAGQRYRSFEYVGGVPLDNRQTMYFYAVEIESPAPERNGTFSFIFTVGSDGKIVSIKS